MSIYHVLAQGETGKIRSSSTLGNWPTWALLSSSDLVFLLANGDSFHSTELSARFKGVIFKIVKLCPVRSQRFIPVRMSLLKHSQIYSILNVCVPVCRYVHMNAGTQGVQKEEMRYPGAGVTSFVRQPIWVLGMDLEFPRIAEHTQLLSLLSGPTQIIF